MKVSIRKASLEDLPKMLFIYEGARAYMASVGNPTQWADLGWPPKALIEQDITAGKSYVAVDESGELQAVFYYDFGEDIEKTYARIYKRSAEVTAHESVAEAVDNGAGQESIGYPGSWLSQEPYGVVHRIAVKTPGKGLGAACLRWAIAQSGGHLRIDTHRANQDMQGLVRKLGFSPRGIILIDGREDTERIAFEILPGLFNT